MWASDPHLVVFGHMPKEKAKCYMVWDTAACVCASPSEADSKWNSLHFGSNILCWGRNCLKGLWEPTPSMCAGSFVSSMCSTSCPKVSFKFCLKKNISFFSGLLANGLSEHRLCIRYLWRRSSWSNHRKFLRVPYFSEQKLLWVPAAFPWHLHLFITDGIAVLG